jgi:polyphosphate glucokinase
MAEETSEMASTRIAIGIDVGGSGIKAAVVDVEAGRLRSERLRVATPTPSTPDAVIASIARLVRRLAKSSGLGDATPVGIGLPGVTIDGTLKSAANIDPTWIDFPVVERLTRLLKRPVFIINDADAAGIAEMRFGIGKGQPGVVIFLTLGTGVGSGVFNDGVLVPNTEFGQMEIRGRAAEKRSAAIARIRRGLSWKAWAADLDEHLERIHELMWPNLMILGGGVSKSADKYVPRLTVRCTVVPAQLRNDAGIIGAAIVAAEAPLERRVEAPPFPLAPTEPAEPPTAAEPAEPASVAEPAAPTKVAKPAKPPTPTKPTEAVAASAPTTATEAIQEATP